jgi:chromosome segregation ATPase
MARRVDKAKRPSGAWSREAPRRAEWLEQQLAETQERFAETQERLTAVERAREEDARQRAELEEQIRWLQSAHDA